MTPAGVVTVLPEFKSIIAKCLGRASIWGLLALEISFASEADCESRVQENISPAILILEQEHLMPS